MKGLHPPARRPVRVGGSGEQRGPCSLVRGPSRGFLPTVGCSHADAGAHACARARARLLADIDKCPHSASRALAYPRPSLAAGPG